MVVGCGLFFDVFGCGIVGLLNKSRRVRVMVNCFIYCVFIGCFCKNGGCMCELGGL